MQKYQHVIHKIEAFFMGITTKLIPRVENSEADELAKAVAQVATLPSDVFCEVINQPSIEMNAKPSKLINAIHCDDWRAPIVAILRGYLKPELKEEENRIRQRARGYKIINVELYKASVIALLLKCVTISEGKQILKQIHEGSCGSHNGPRALVGKGSIGQPQSMMQPR